MNTRALVLLCPLLASLPMAACQKTDCDSIKEHAQDCRVVESAPAGRNGGICEKYRDVKGKAGMQSYAQCVTKLRCDDKAGLAACIDASTNEDAPACERLNGYLVACGLEPASGGLECSEYGGTQNTAAFAGYVQCVLDKGCLNSADAGAALDECRNSILGNAAATLTSCQRVENRAKACAEDQPTVVTCSLQVAPFTAASVDKWADCYVKAPCGDFAARANCAAELDIAQVNPGGGTTVACSKVSLFQLRCGVRQLPVIGDPNTCEQSLQNFTKESAEDFGDCLLETDCMSAAGLLACAGELRTN
ncbi:MAG: hypothetical protein IT381_16530 [Deltaproteobacteria bacterium]|nr:hypothetical protein [Deltaproteobacteria bacterium]